MHRMLFRAAAYSVDYVITPGGRDAMTVFDLPAGETPAGGLRFVTPVCFEDTNPRLIAEMFRPASDTPRRKRADFLVNITNDGWFSAQQKTQHLQTATLRSIENRVWSVRSANTGISGFIDPAGRHAFGTTLLRPDTAGTLFGRVSVGGPVTFFTIWGDAFAVACVGLTPVAVASAMRWRAT
jgi:apolipoprotein N-acyltransferase